MGAMIGKKGLVLLFGMAVATGCAKPHANGAAPEGVIGMDQRAEAGPTPSSVISYNPLPKKDQDRIDEKLRLEKERMDRAEALFKAGKLREAERACEATASVLHRHDGRLDPGIAHLFGRIDMKQGRYAEAVRVMAPNVQRDIPLQRLDLALSYVEVGDTARARALYDPDALFSRTTAFESDQGWAPDVRSPLALKGALLWAKGMALSDVARKDEAVECYEQASRLLPKNPVLALNLAVEARNVGRFQESSDALQIVQSLGNARTKRMTRDLAVQMKSAATVERAKAVEEEKDKASVAPERAGG